MLETMRNYLLSSKMPSEDKRYTMNFCKKIQYLDELHQHIAKDTGEHVNVGYGNVNSKICFVVQNEQVLSTIKPLLQDILDKFNITFWSIYVTFVDKTASDYPKKHFVLVNEIHAVNPDLLYVFDVNDKIYNDITQAFGTYQVALPQKHLFVDVRKLHSSDTEVRKELWNLFKYLINYKEIE